MGGFGAVFGRKGDAGFTGPLLWVCSGVVGFNVAMFLRAVRGICRPARPDVGAGTKKFALRAHNGQKLAFDGALGKYFRGNAAEEAVPGEFVVPCTWQPGPSSGFNAQLNPIGGMVGSPPRTPPIGLTCA